MTNKLITIENQIYTIRGFKVMLDTNLAKLYSVETKRLNEAVKRNLERFPSDFMFQLTSEELSEVVANCDHLKEAYKFSYQKPYAFTENGVAMLSSVLKSPKAINANIQIMRTYTAIRQLALTTANRNIEIEELRKLLVLYIEQNDEKVNQIINVLNNLIDNPKEPQQIGFKTD